MSVVVFFIARHIFIEFYCVHYLVCKLCIFGWWPLVLWISSWICYVLQKSSSDEYQKRCVHFYACVCAFASDDKLQEEFAFFTNLDFSTPCPPTDTSKSFSIVCMLTFPVLFPGFVGKGNHKWMCILSVLSGTYSGK